MFSYTPDNKRPLKYVLLCVAWRRPMRKCHVHIAGYTDKFWEQNVHVVWDGTQAGEWHPSTPAWKEFIQREVDGQVRSASAGDR